MRVLFAHNLAPDHPRAGGGQRVTQALAEALARRGLDVHCLYVADPATSTPLPEATGTTTHAFPTTGRLLLDALRMGGRARSLADRLGLDVVHGSSPEAGGIALRLPRRIGLVGTSHHPDPPELGDAPSARRPLARLGWMRRRQAPLLERSLLRRAHRVVAVSRYGADALRSRGYLSADAEVTVIPNGLPSEWLAGEPADPGREGPVLFVGRMEPQKGVDLVLRAVARLPGARAELVGEGPDRGRYEELARDLELAGRVTFTGLLPPAEVRERMRSAAVVAVPSRWELFGMVLLEAMAVGVPVVATRVGGMPEVVRDGMEGVLVPPEDPDALARALSGLLDRPERRRELGRAGRTRAETFRWDDLAESWEAELARAAREARRLAG